MHPTCLQEVGLHEAGFTRIFVCRAKAQRRKEIGEDFSNLPEEGQLGTFVYLALEDAKLKRKTLRVLAR